MTVRVLVVDDQQLVRAGLRMLCQTADDLEVVAEAATGAEAVRLAARLTPDVVLMDLRMPGMDGIRATARILADRPTARVVVLTTFDDDDHLYPALAAGACGFLVKDASPADLLAGIRRAAAGDHPFTPEVLRRVLDSALTARTEADPAAPVADLTAREREVLDLVAEGLSNTEIANRLHVGITTVKTHVTNLMAKTGADNRVRLALLGHGRR
ncbi:Response regulator protein vraR [Nocardia otitidiscaviarum]|uniref:Response regulator protein vraR n=1 Tax=Nocardia otitidiscaviarum TaxID=1823 RepID=A0A378YQR1_9NOCA|nr:response regulator transcription factor [Nocardia otitidiscaviarum]MBF6238924.1 response regulator transcription factor [Nocardia otitidiscaviarum]SUA79073.1 Response regulator protein vraR [Nocardia otitidiscaviarum]